MRHAWLALFLLLFVLLYAAVIYDASIPNPLTSVGGVSISGGAGFLEEWGLIASLIGAAFITVILRVLYVGLKRLFS